MLSEKFEEKIDLDEMGNYLSVFLIQIYDFDELLFIIKSTLKIYLKLKIPLF